MLTRTVSCSAVSVTGMEAATTATAAGHARSRAARVRVGSVGLRPGKSHCGQVAAPAAFKASEYTSLQAAAHPPAAIATPSVAQSVSGGRILFGPFPLSQPSPSMHVICSRLPRPLAMHSLQTTREQLVRAWLAAAT